MERKQQGHDVEQHPLDPFFPDGARILMLGSFPPPRSRWKMDFYYPNLQNDMWRIFGLVFKGDKDFFLTDDKKLFTEQKIREFLVEKGIAISDTAREVIRRKGNASDKFLEIVSVIDLRESLAVLPECRAIVTTGQKATDVLLSLTGADEPRVGGYSVFRFEDREMRLYRMPSSSRAYPKPLDEKAAVYEMMFKELGLM